MKKKVVLIGACGAIARVCIKVLGGTLFDIFEIVAGVDPASGNTQYSFPLFSNWKEFLNSHIAADAALIMSPPETHQSSFRQALEAGLDICIEKPPALSSRECSEMLSSMKRFPNQRLFFGWHARYASGVPELRKLLATEKVQHIHCTYKEDVRAFRTPGTTDFRPGCVWDSMINLISVLLHLLPGQTWEILDAKTVDSAKIGVPTDAKVEFVFKKNGTIITGFIDQEWMFASEIERKIRIQTDAHVYVLDLHKGTLKKGRASIIRKTQDPMEHEYASLFQHFHDCMIKRELYAPFSPVTFVEDIYKII